ncbi:carbohydrate porin [Opitutaceae bacterium TAV4]|uniref:carbohydrate porin n=1 Tax=Geminisphaera colitermitum TaxID=1148786 RepID=UPI000158C4A6|nr:carbohydrate porin [Geminisphaera colitermitum]RRJ94546.1 carbohydrate porin [Opitutaceae bacterium TAV4]RRJ98606.1 carbohydrate porin [Opitutaceae bacterium TAV3]
MKNSTFLSLLAAGALAVPAFAQTAEPSDAPTAKWGPRIALEDNGIRPWVTVTGELWNNVDGDMIGGRDNLWNTLVDFGVEIDLGKFGGPATGMIVLQGHWTESSDSSGGLGSVGSHNSASNIWASDSLRAFNLYYTQSWNNGEYAVKIGQIAADDDFMGSDYSSLFLNGSFGTMPAATGATPRFGTDTVAYNGYPVAAPGVWFKWTPNEKYSWQNAIYLGGPGDDIHSNHGFDWKSLSSTGFLWMTEGAVNFDLAGKPSTFKLGGTLHTKDFENYDTGNTESTVYSLYFVHDFAISMNADKVGLGGFWRASITPQEDVATAFIYMDAGINWFAPFASRPDDVAGAALSWTKLGGAYKDSVNAENGNEFTLELTYKAQLTSYWTLQADVQYVINPVENDDNAIVLGLRTVLNF